jgi:hypothetical protein
MTPWSGRACIAAPMTSSYWAINPNAAERLSEARMARRPNIGDRQRVLRPVGRRLDLGGTPESRVAAR